MIIERVEITSFGNLQDVTLEFGAKVNVLVGANEAGKSTVAAFIRYMLYGFGTHHAQNDVSEREKRVSWHTGTAEGAMNLRLRDGRRLRIERRTEATQQGGRIGYREESRLFDLADGSLLRAHSRPGEEFFAVPEQVYINTAHFSQFTARLNENETTQAMENLLFSGDERVSSQRAVKRMQQARYSLSHPSGVGGAIYELSAQADAARMRLTSAARRSAQIHKTETDLHKLSVKIAAAERERDRLAEVDTYYRGYLTICSFDKLHEVENHYSTLAAEREALRERNSCGSFLPDEDYLSSLQTAERVCEIARQNYIRTIEKLEAVKKTSEVDAEERALLDAAEQEGGTKAVEKAYSSLYRAAGLHHMLAWTLVAVAALLLGLTAFLFRPFMLSPVTAFLLVLVLTSLVFSGCFFRNRTKKQRRIADLCHRFGAATGGELLCRMNAAEKTARLLAEASEGILRAEENAEISRENYEGLVCELTSITAKWGKKPHFSEEGSITSAVSDEARAYLQEERRLSEELAEVRGRMTGLREELAGKSEIAIRAEVPPASREAMKKINYKTIQEGLSYYRTTCENFHTQYKVLLDELNEYRRTAENPALLRIELSAMEERVAAMRRQYRAYGIASDAIENASDRLRAEISPRLSKYAGNLLAMATEGRYRGLDVTNRLFMTYREGDAVRPLASMSGSACEIAYISLRLALIDMLYEEIPPLCFDESLSHQDDERTGNIVRLLSTVAEQGMQSILLTCHEREAEIAKASSEEAVCLRL